MGRYRIALPMRREGIALQFVSDQSLRSLSLSSAEAVFALTSSGDGLCATSAVTGLASLRTGRTAFGDQSINRGDNDADGSSERDSSEFVSRQESTDSHYTHGQSTSGFGKRDGLGRA